MSAAGDRANPVDLELLALARLGLARSVPASLGGVRGGLVDALSRSGTLAAGDADRVRTYLSQNVVACGCGDRALPGDSELAWNCGRCSRVYHRRSGGLWQAARAAPPPRVGSRVGPLELTKILGKGAQGTVFLARHTQLNRTSAVKILPAVPPDDPKRKRFAREVEALGRLNHPSIVRIHATFEVEGTLACEMELVTGETLEERTEKKGPLPWRDAVTLVAKLARATAHAHQSGVLHRDLKPANVILREGTGEPLLVDFGLSRFTDIASSLTVAGAQLGTPFYMAPEAFSGDSSERTDVYGLGTILYQCLTGNPPFRETQLAALYHKATKGLCEPTNAPGAPAALEDVRSVAMAPDPERRFPTALALAQDLEALLVGSRPSASAQVQAARVRGRERSRFALAAGLAVLGVAVGALAAQAGAHGRRSRGPDVGTVPGAVECLEREPGPGVPDARARARETLVLRAASDPSAVRRALDVALARAPESLELRRARALVDRARGVPLERADLAAVGSLADAAGDLDALALHAAAAGFVDPEGSLETARSVRAARRDSRGAALLDALLLADTGDAGLRDELVLALRTASPIPPNLPRAVALERAALAIDRLAALVLDEDRREQPELAKTTREAEDALVQLARLFGSNRPVALVMEPLADAIRRMWGRANFAGAVSSECRRHLVLLYEGVQKAGVDVGARLVLLRELLRMGDDLTKSEPDLKLSVDAADAAACDIAIRDPLAAAVALQWTATAYADQVPTPAPLPPEAVARAWRAIDLCAGCVAWFLGSELLREGGVPTETEVKWCQHALRRIAAAEAVLHERRAANAPDEARRLSALELALDARRRAFVVSACGQMFVGNLRNKDSKRVVEILLELGQLRGAESALEFAPRAEVVRIEAVRQTEGGIADPRSALEQALAVKPPCAESLSIAARSQADLGRPAEARATLATLEAYEKHGAGSLYEHFGSARTARYLERKAPR